jgi:hypothetical protein
MKRVEAFIAVKKQRVVPALEALNLQVIFYESKGMGKGEKYRLSYTSQFELESVHYIFKDSRYKPCLGKDTQYDDHYGSNA